MHFNFHLRAFLSAFTTLALLLAAPTAAQTPLGTAFTYQGQLKSSGSPANGSFTMIFKLFDAATLGNQAGPTLTFDGIGGDPLPVAVSSGLFSVQLDFGPAYNGDQRWLEITVSGTPLSPRQSLTAAPYALNVRAPLSLSGNVPASDVLKTTNTASADGTVAIYGEATAASGQTYGVLGVNNSAAGNGVFGLANNGTGVRGQSPDGLGIGVYGFATNPAGTNYGVYGQTASPTGYGGYFLGRGYFSKSVGIGTASPGVGIQLDVQQSNGIAVSGTTAGPNDAAVYGIATDSAGTNVGVYGKTNSPNGIGGYFVNLAPGGLAVYANGTAQMTGFKMPTGASAGSVLTSDGSGVGTWQSPLSGGCQVGLTNCGGTCRDLQSDNNNCGACGNVCPPGTRCVNGTCQASCQSGLTSCNNICRDLQTDDNNCGSCGTVCPNGTRCVNGSCQLSCAQGQTNCGGICVNESTDDNNCGACGNACPSGTRCVNGNCQLSCPQGQFNCNGTCVNLSTDNNNCAQCGRACASGQICVNGNCQVVCQTGQVNCSGMCRNLLTDNTNCGSCGAACPTGTKCVNGACQPCP